MEELFYEMKTNQDEEQFSMIGFSSLYTSPLHQDFDSFSFPVNNYPLDYVLHDQPIVIPGSQLSIDFNQFPPLPPPPPLPGVQVAANTVEMKKKNHNAGERMRRMKLNRLFDALRSVLPGAEHMKKLGAPSTVDNVITYIPQLRMEVEALIHKKQQLVTIMTTTNDVVFSAAPSAWTNDTTAPSSSSLSSFASWSVQVTKLGNAEVSIQISSPKSPINTFIPITEVLRKLEEEDGLVVIEFSSADSSAVRIFYNMHLIKEEEANEIDCERLRKELIYSCQQWEKMCLWMITQG